MKVFVIHWQSESCDHYLSAHDHELTDKEMDTILVNSSETEKWDEDYHGSFDPAMNEGHITVDGVKYVTYLYVSDSEWCELNSFTAV